MLIFGGTFSHSQYVSQLHKSATADLHVSCCFELKLNRETLALTEANKQHVQCTIVTNIFTKCTRGMRFVKGKFDEWCLRIICIQWRIQNFPEGVPNEVWGKVMFYTCLSVHRGRVCYDVTSCYGQQPPSWTASTPCPSPLDSTSPRTVPPGQQVGGMYPTRLLSFFSLIIQSKFPQNCMKMKKIGPGVSEIRPCRSATVSFRLNLVT